MNTKKAIALVVAMVVIAGATLIPANASVVENDPLLIWYTLIKTGSKQTEYGPITGKIYSHTEYNDNCSILSIAARSEVDSAYTMRKIATGIECVRTSAGTSEPGWSISHYTTNSNEDLTYLSLYSLASEELITIYTSHQILYTNAYVLYQVAQTTGIIY